MTRSEESGKFITILVVMSVVSAINAASVVPINLCRLTVDNSVFNLESLRNHEDLPITKVGSPSVDNYTIVSSLCAPIDLDAVRMRFANNKGGEFQYTPLKSDFMPNVIIVKQNLNNSVEAFELASSKIGVYEDWVANYDDVKKNSNDQLFKSLNNLEIKYSLENNKIESNRRTAVLQCYKY